jgi:hypothetical protein
MLIRTVLYFDMFYISLASDFLKFVLYFSIPDSEGVILCVVVLMSGLLFQSIDTAKC